MGADTGKQFREQTERVDSDDVLEEHPGEEFPTEPYRLMRIIIR